MKTVAAKNWEKVKDACLQQLLRATPSPTHAAQRNACSPKERAHCAHPENVHLHGLAWYGIRKGRALTLLLAYMFEAQIYEKVSMILLQDQNMSICIWLSNIRIQGVGFRAKAEDLSLRFKFIATRAENNRKLRNNEAA